ncbi:MAG: hypothetical protein LW650_08200 [Planctomycetaceae bacterium]|jgi:TolB protein|nr:PD40 domain-containing protein [Phycisphaerales bacterium]MCE2653464.1 hypothetical protein [Planctomycetaceae bacterium]
MIRTISAAVVLALAGCACGAQSGQSGQSGRPAAAAPAAPATPATPASTGPVSLQATRQAAAQAEAPLLSGHVQLTFPEQFVRAGEAYFDHHQPPRSIVFQAIPVPPEGQGPGSNYDMYVADLKRDESGNITGLGTPKLISPPGSANTCGWFHPQRPNLVVFGSTIKPPVATDAPGYSRDRQRYSWQFPPEMEIVSVSLDTADVAASLQSMFKRPGYDAEGSFSADGRFYLYTHVDPANNDPNLWIHDTRTGKHYPIVTARGYDGGPFFSPDGKSIIYRSDRQGNNNLQLFWGELAFGDDGDPAVPIGLKREMQLTPDADEVNWCPFFHPGGGYAVFASSAQGHQNYEVYAIELDAAKAPAGLRRARVTHAPGFDGLPVISDDGSVMMWTSQRGDKLAREQRPSSQLWVAKMTGTPAWTDAASPAKSPGDSK